MLHIKLLKPQKRNDDGDSRQTILNLKPQSLNPESLRTLYRMGVVETLTPKYLNRGYIEAKVSTVWGTLWLEHGACVGS